MMLGFAIGLAIAMAQDALSDWWWCQKNPYIPVEPLVPNIWRDDILRTFASPLLTLGPLRRNAPP